MLFTITVPAFGAMLLISSSSNWYPWLEGLNSWALPVYMILTIVFAGLSLTPTHASSLIAGMLFGLLEGPVYAIIAIVLASYLALILINHFVKENSYSELLKRPTAARLHEELLKKSGLKAVWFISLVRLSPVMPFAATNVLLAASNVKSSHFLLGSLIGLAPRIIIVAIAGAGLAELDFSKGSNIALAILGGAATFLLIFYVGLTFKKIKKNVLGEL